MRYASCRAVDAMPAITLKTVRLRRATRGERLGVESDSLSNDVLAKAFRVARPLGSRAT